MHVQGKYRALFTAVCVALLTPAIAEQRSQEENSLREQDIETITVVATRTERPLNEVAATVSVQTAEQLEQELAQDIADAVRYEPGVSVAGTGSRFGLSGFNIRGIEGNRVLTLVDGIRVPEEFSFGPFLSARRDFVDLESLSRMEVARGPISSLYGSDALGGVVALQTKQPGDYLSDDASYSVSMRAGYSGADDSYLSTLNLAGRVGVMDSLARYTRRSGHESDNMGSVGGTGSAREHPDPLASDIENVTLKFVFNLSATQQISLDLDAYENDMESQILSDYGTLSRGTLIESRDADDVRSRERWSLGYRYSGDLLFADTLEAKIYRQESTTDQHTKEHRTTPRRTAQVRFRESSFAQQIAGAWILMRKQFTLGSSSHLLSLGADYYQTESESMREGRTFDAAGAPLREFVRFPTRDFPPTQVRQVAAFVQNEISLFDGRLSLSPGFRIDKFEAEADADEIYLSGNLGTPLPSDYDTQEVTAKLGAVFAINEQFSIYGRFAEGFRAPPYDDVNVGFTNFLGGYKTISNPDLASESSTGMEFGARWSAPRGSMHIAYFRNEYQDFIESLAVAPIFLSTRGIDPADGFLTFQSVNRGEVTISGWELRAEWDLTSQWYTRAALAYAEGEDKARNAPLNTIEPLNAVFGIGYDSTSERWGARLLCTLSGDKDESDIDPQDPRLPTDAFTLVDLIGWVRFGEGVKVNLGIFNLTDERALRWVDTVGIGDDAPARFTQPGTNAAISVFFEL